MSKEEVMGLCEFLKLRGYENTNNISKFIFELQQENKQLKDNWDELKKWVNKHYEYYMNEEDYIGGRLCFTDIKNKIQELQGGDSNE